MFRLKNISALFFIVFLLSSCSVGKDTSIWVTNAKMANGIDSDYMPVDATNVFPEGTSKVFCWFSWKAAKKDTNIKAKWHYVTDDIPVLDYTFVVPRKEGSGSVSLAMPEGNKLPPGLYQVTLASEGQQLKLLTFKVLGKK